MMDARFEKMGIPVEEPKQEGALPVIDLTKKTRAKAEYLFEMTCRINSCLFGGGGTEVANGDTEPACLADDLKLINGVLGKACYQLEMIQKNLGM